jgi:hypothetical protein
MPIAKPIQVSHSGLRFSETAELITLACVAVTYVTNPGLESAACRPIAALSGMTQSGTIFGEAKGMTCAQVKAMYPSKSFLLFVYSSYAYALTRRCELQLL